MSALLTFLFTDIEGSSALWDDHPDHMRPAHQLHHQILINAISEQGGSVVKDLGDGFMAVFADPTAALVAAAQGQRELSASDWSDLSRPLKVRMGVHTGPAEQRGDDYYGPDVNIAARLEGLAHGGQVLVSDATNALTARSLPDGVTTRDLGPQRLKGIGLAERVHQLVIDGVDSDFPLLGGGGIGAALPEYPGELYGRDEEVHDVVKMVRGGSRLITLLGAGGIGKTRLAVEAARQLTTDSATYFADMAPIRAAAEIGPSFAEALGIHAEGTVDPFEVVADRITDSTVAVMDNLEHLTSVGPSISSLLAACPSITLIATSRSPLRIREETVFPVSPLAIGSNGSSAAVDLFYERAAAQGVFLSPEDRGAVRSLCERVDGLPLAIELIAAQTRLLSVTELDHMLQQSLDALGTGGEDRPDRHRTIRDTIEWSLGGLSDRQRSIFAQLSVFPAGPTLEQLAFVREETPGQLLDDMATLADNSLVSPQTGLEGGTRFGQLALLREYGAELAAESGAGDQALGRLVDYYLESSESIQDGLWSNNSSTRALANDHANLVAAMQWSLDHERAEEMAGFLADIWIYWFNGDRTQTAADFVRTADPQVTSAKFEWLAGFILGFQLGDFEAAAERMSKAESMFADEGDDYWVAMSQMWRGTSERDPVKAREILEAAHDELAKHTDRPAIRPLALLFISVADTEAGLLDEALEKRLLARDLAVAIDHRELNAWLPWNIAATYLNMGDPATARAQLGDAFEIMADQAYQEGIASFGQLLGAIAIRQGSSPIGLELIGASDAVMDRIGVATWGEVAMLRDRALDEAREALGADDANALYETSRGIGLLDLVEAVRAELNESSTT